MTTKTNTETLIGLRISYEDVANLYKEGRVLRVETLTTPGGLELPEIATIAWEENDGTIRISKMHAGSLRNLLNRSASRGGHGIQLVVAK